MMKVSSEKSSLLILPLLSILLRLQCYCFSQVSAITCIENERKALLQLKNSFEEDPSLRLASWKEGTNCCNWDGVGCNQTTGHVTKIDLQNNQVHFSPGLLSNSTDSSLLEFKFLNYLDLSGNDFNYSQIPSFLGSMVELRYLDLSLASLYGNVPPHLGNLTNLVFLDLSPYDNYDLRRLKLLNGGDGEWISGLSSLQTLDLSWVNFPTASNLMQVLTSLPLSFLRLSSCNLQNLDLAYDSLNGSLFLTRIQLLDLSSNNFTGPIPEAFQNTTSLRFLYLSGNKFTSIKGGLSSFIGNNNCRLKELYLSGNLDLGGDVFGGYGNESVGCNRYDLQVLDLGSVPVKNKIPNWLGKFMNLQVLYLGYCYIYGSIPASLGNLSNVESISLAGNDLSGAIPTSFGRLLNLRSLELGYNRLEEVGVESFSQLRNLEALDISGNGLKGVISEGYFANLSKLDSLSMGYNSFLFDMKSNWVPPFQLTFFQATWCMCFGSKFPRWLQTQTELRYLILENSSISSPLPTRLRGKNLGILVLSHNQIVGPLPTRMGDQMPNLREVYLNDNHINDSLPPSFCKLKSLRVLDLSNNRMSGMVHGCFLTSNLQSLDLSSNEFSGAFPYSSPGNLSNVVQLYLTNNKFEGSFPIVLKTSIFLLYLDVEGNNFSGNIPTWVGYHLTDLRFLNLRGNMLNGTIPSSLCLLPHLQILDLAHNRLGGNIPPNLNNLSVMAGKIESEFTSCNAPGCTFVGKNVQLYLKSRKMDYSFSQIELMVNLDLSHNSLVGFIPSKITMLIKLVGLNLSHNDLTGTIPADMGEIVSLQSLDLSFNQLSGPIPTSMSKLSSLGMLELSHNNLSGDIPREGHLSTFNEASGFDSNPFLCGDPLPVKCAIEKRVEPPFGIENQDQEEEEKWEKWEKWLLYTMIMLGYLSGFWAVVGVLILKRSWRYAYFRFVEKTASKVLKRFKGIFIPK